MLWEICELQFFPRNIKIRAKLTRDHYRSAINQLGQHLGKIATLDDLNDDTLTGFLLWLVDEVHVRETTANSTVGRIKTLWTWMAKRGMVKMFPTSQRLPEPELQPVAWSHAELQALFDAAKKMPGTVGPFLASCWWQTLLAWLWNTGERIGATTKMEWKHIDLRACTASLPASIRKFHRKPAMYHLWPAVVEMLERIKRPDGLVFPWDKTVHTFYHHYDRLLKLAGLPGGRKRKAHAMRVSHATWTAFAGGDATRALLHDDPLTTKRHYLDPRMLPDTGVVLFKPWEPT
jgi:integrase